MASGPDPAPPARAQAHPVQRFIEPATLVAAGSALLYLSGLTYYRAYYRALSLPGLEFSHSPQDHLLQGFFSLAFLLLALFFLAEKMKKNRRRWAPFLLSGLIVMGALLVAAESAFYGTIFGYDPGLFMRWMFAVAGALVAASTFLWMRKAKRVSSPKIDSEGMILFSVFLIMSVLSGSSLIGQGQAKEDLASPADRLSTLTFKGNSTHGLEGVPVLLVRIVDDLVYVIDLREEGVPRAFVFPASEILSIELDVAAAPPGA